LNLYNVKPIFDESYKLTDIGSIIPITEKIWLILLKSTKF
jgi:hypothetical protein